MSAPYPAELMAGQWTRRPTKPAARPAPRPLPAQRPAKAPRPAPQSAVRPLAPQLVTVGEIATALRVSRMTVYRLIRDEELPAIRVGRSLRVPLADLRAYVERNRLNVALDQVQDDEL